MNKEYIQTLINIYSDEKSNQNLNIFLNEKKDINNQFNIFKKIFRNFSLFIYFIIVLYFSFNFFQNLFLGEKLDYFDGILLFLSFVSILFWFVVNDCFYYILNKIYNFHYKTIKNDMINSEQNVAVLDLIDNLKMLENFNLKQKIENNLQNIQDNNPKVLEEFYKSHEFSNSEIKEYVFFLIEQSNSEDDY